MALKFSFNSATHGVTYPEAYGKILEGQFTPDVVHLIFGIFASQDAVAKQQTLDLLAQQADAAQQNGLLKEQELQLLVQAVQDASNAEKTETDLFAQGRSSDEKIAAAKAATQKASDAADKAREQLAGLMQIDSDLRAGLAQETPVNPIEIRKYTFPLKNQTVDENGFFTLLYNLIKLAPEFKDAVDV